VVECGALHEMRTSTTPFLGFWKKKPRREIAQLRLGWFEQRKQALE
jgi:hypothetical protein